MAAGPTGPIIAVRFILTDALPLPALPEQREEEEDGSRDSIAGCHGLSLQPWHGRAAFGCFGFSSLLPKLEGVL